MVVATGFGTFYHIRLHALGKKGQVDRWFKRESIVKIDTGSTTSDSQESLQGGEDDVQMNEDDPENVESGQGMAPAVTHESLTTSGEVSETREYFPKCDKTTEAQNHALHEQGTGASDENIGTSYPQNRVVIGIPGQGDSSSSDGEPGPPRESSRCSQQ